MNETDLRDIVSRAAPLWDRLRIADDSTNFCDEDRAQTAFETWRQTIVGVSDDSLRKRIEWAGWTVERVRQVLGSASRPLPLHELPAWSDTLRQINEIARRTFNANASLALDHDGPAPFQELLFPAVLCARNKLPGAPRELELPLLKALAELSARALEAEFAKGVPAGRQFLSFIVGNANASKTRYNHFVKTHLDDGLSAIFREYPVLARLVCNCVDLWVEASSEFLSRVQTDLDLLGESGVAEVRGGLSDPHNGHRSVVAVVFKSGRKLVYKPKNLGLEEAFSGILRWCNEHGIEPALKAPVVWNRGAYGWVEYIEHLPCSDESEASRYFERAGMLLCLLYIFQATDGHMENVIACGEHPVLVDAETLLQPEMARLEGSIGFEDWSPGNRDFASSVLRAGLLPTWEINLNAHSAIDVSGFGGAGGQESTQRRPQLKNANTDNMHFVNERGRLPESGNAVRLNEQLLNSSDFVDSIINGFARMYDLILKHRNEFLSEHGPLKWLRAQPTRWLFRGTRIYAGVLMRSEAPEFLRDGVSHSIALDAVSRAFLTTQDRPRMWPILECEIRSLEQRDIPYFEMTSDSRALGHGLDQPINDFFAESGLDRAVARIGKLSPADMDLQLALIRGAFTARSIGSDVRRESGGRGPFQDLSGLEPMTRDELVAEAQRLAEEITSRALRTDSGLYWIGMSPVSDLNHYQVRPLGENLYEGACGVALFLAALDDVTGGEDHWPIIDQALRFVRSACGDHKTPRSAALVHAMGIGGIGGLASVIYAMVRIGCHLKREDLLEDAARAARLLSAEVIENDRHFDVMSGSAGVILGLLALHRAAPRAAGVIETAIDAGKHLLKNRVAGHGEFRAWRNSASRPLTGFSHGAAGIAYALTKLYEVTLDSSFLDAAHEAIAYERALFDPEASNWPDLRTHKVEGFACSWCHGAPGIGLARLGVSTTVNRDDVRSDIAAAVRRTSEATLDDVDHLCCGNFGRLELMLQAGQRAHALRAARWIYHRAQTNQGYRLVHKPIPGVYSPAFFRGTAGIGHQLLRLADPNAVPSVLLMQ